MKKKYQNPPCRHRHSARCSRHRLPLSSYRNTRLSRLAHWPADTLLRHLLVRFQLAGTAYSP